MPDLIDVVADSMQIARAQASRYYRELRQAGLAPTGRAGRGGFQAEATSHVAAILIVGIASSESARGAVKATRKLAKAKGQRVYRMMNGTVEETISPAETSIIGAVTALIDIARSPDIQYSFLSHDFSIRISSAQNDIWADVVLPLREHDRGVGFYRGTQQEVSFLFASGRAHLESTDEIPVWAQPAALVRASTVANWVIQDAAEFLGRYSDSEWSAL